MLLIGLLTFGVTVLAVITVVNYQSLQDSQAAQKRLSTSVAANQQADTQALCALRADLQTRVNSTNAFLVTHPHGIPGISAATLRSGVAGQERTIRALSTINCRPTTAKEY
jgi:hypothetical protein